MSRKSIKNKQHQPTRPNPQKSYNGAQNHLHVFLPGEGALAQIERVCPGSTERMIQMMEKQQAHDNEMDRKESERRSRMLDQNDRVLELDNKLENSSRFALVLFFVIQLTFSVLAFYLYSQDKDYEALIPLAIACAPIAKSFFERTPKSNKK